MLLRLLLCGVLAGLPGGAAQHRYRVYPNARIAVLAIGGDDRGTVWLGAADGLYRFDGARYTKVPDFPLPKVTHVAVDGEGTLWAGGIEGLARWRRGEARAELVHRAEVLGLSGKPFVLAATVDRTWRPLPDGTLKQMHTINREFLVQGPRVWFPCIGYACRLDYSVWGKGSPPVYAQVGDQQFGWLGTEFDQVGEDREGLLWAANEREAVAFREGKRTASWTRASFPKLERQLPIVMGPAGQLWLVGDDRVDGLSPRTKFFWPEEGRSTPPTAGWEDGRGHFWVALRGLGLVEWTLDTGWERWSRERHLQGADTVMVRRDARGQLVAATHDRLFRLAEPSRDFTGMDSELLRFEYLYPLAGGGWLASNRQRGLVRLDGNGGVVETVKGAREVLSGFRAVAQDGEGRIWAANRQFLSYVQGRPGSWTLAAVELPRPANASDFVSPLDFQMDEQKRLWVGHAEGLSVLEGGRAVSVRVEPPVKKVRSFALGKDEIWVAYREPGKFTRLRRDGEIWRGTDFSAQTGHGPPDTHFLKRDSRGWIWRGTPEGVLVSDGQHLGPEDWLHLEPDRGFGVKDTDQYGFFEDRDGSVWVAGAEGVAHVKPDAAWFRAPEEEPVLTGFAVTGDVAVAEVGTLGASPLRGKGLRYRLLPGSGEWRFSADGALRFDRLRAGEYTLEVAYAGLGEPPVLRRMFVVTGALSGVWRWWILLPGMVVGMGGLAAWRSEWARYWMAKWRFRLRWRMGMERESYEIAPGEVLRGHYRVIRLLSEGGFSRVYEVTDLRQAGWRLALKVVLPVPGRPEWMRERFAFEVATVKSIAHPGVVAVLDSWMDERGWPCLVMPLLEGPALRDVLADGPLDTGRAARLIGQLGAALGEIHGRGVVHRDVKPDNVILTGAGADEQAVLIDFGAAAFLAMDGELATTRLVAASLRYAAPERLTGHYSAASDVYSLAVTVLEVLAGRQPVGLGEAPGSEAFERALALALRTPLGEEAGNRVAALLAQGFQPDSRLRPADAGAWSAAIAAELSRADRAAT